MKSILIFSIILTMVGCASQKKANESQAALPESTAKYVGKILENEGCGNIILTSVDGVEVMLYAINLSDEFKVPFMKVQFDYIDSRAMLPENCKATKVVVVENMTAVK
jgi:hypothetical protein